MNAVRLHVAPLLSAHVCTKQSLPVFLFPRRVGTDRRYSVAREDISCDARQYRAVLHGVECLGHRDCAKGRC